MTAMESPNLPESPASRRVRRFSYPCVHVLTGLMVLFVAITVHVSGTMLFYEGSLYATTNLEGVNFSNNAANAARFAWGVPFHELGVGRRSLLALVQLTAAFPVLLILWNL